MFAFFNLKLLFYIERMTGCDVAKYYFQVFLEVMSLQQHLILYTLEREVGKID